MGGFFLSLFPGLFSLRQIYLPSLVIIFILILMLHYVFGPQNREIEKERGGQGGFTVFKYEKEKNKNRRGVPQANS